jgi:predicted metal-dependent hydrolase
MARGTEAPLDARLAPGRAAFNRGEFFLAHELWEDVWRELDGGERLLVQGLIQIAAGLHHLQRGRAGPAARVLARGASKLSRAPATTLPIAALARDVARLLAALSAPGGAAPDPGAMRF